MDKVEELRQKLIEWDCGPLLDTLKENGVNSLALLKELLCNPDELKGLIPNIGYRIQLKLRSKEENLIDNNVNIESTHSFSTDTLDSIRVSSNFEEPPKKYVILDVGHDLPGTSTSSTSRSAPAAPSTPPQKYVILDVGLDLPGTSTSSTSRSASVAPSEDFDLSSLLRRSSTPTSASTAPFRHSFDDFNLSSLLQETLVGKTLQSFYSLQGNLDSRCQSYLVEIIVQYFVNIVPFRRLTNIDFDLLSNEIIRIFPKEEKLVYYTPPLTKKTSKISKSGIARGKLVDKYRNKLTFIRKAGLLPSRSEDVDSDVDNDSLLKENTDFESDIIWLKNNNQPWSEVIKKFTSTRNYRFGMLKKDVEIEEIFASFPILCHDLGYTLIEEDFNIKFPTTAQKLYLNFEIIFNKLLDLRRNHLNQSDSLILELLNENLNIESRHYLMLTLLSALLPTKIFNKKNKKNWSPTSTEIKEALVIHVKNPGDIKTTIESKKSKLENYALPLLPFIIIEGPSYLKIENIYLMTQELHYTNVQLALYWAVRHHMKFGRTTGGLYYAEISASVIYAVCSISKFFLDLHSKNRLLEFDILYFLNEWIIEYQSVSLSYSRTIPYILWLGGLFSKIMPIETLSAYIAKTVHNLENPHVKIRLAALRALCYHTESFTVANNAFLPIAHHIASVLIQQLAHQEGTIVFIGLRALRKVLKVPGIITESIKLEIVNLTVNVFLANIGSPETVRWIHPLLKRLCQQPRICEYIKEQFMPNILNILRNISLLLGDNLGLNSIIGMTESFSSNFFCRSHKNLTQYITMETLSNTVIRTPDDYPLHVNANSHGIKEICVWNQLPYFHCSINIHFDIMHDLYEGVCRYDFGRILKALIFDEKRFTLEILNNRIQYFNHTAADIGNKILPIPRHQIENNMVIMSSAEMHAFVTYFGLIIGDLADTSSDVWQFYLVLFKIIQIVSKDSTHEDELKHLQFLIKEHHSNYISLFNSKLTPKFHFLIHYPRIIKEIGALSKVSSIRFEAFHKIAKSNANVVCSRRNLPLTLCTKLELRLAYRLILNKGFVDDIVVGSLSSIDNKELDSRLVQIFFDKEIIIKDVFVATWIKINGIIYKKNLIILINRDTYGEPEFGKIVDVLYINNDCVYLVISRCDCYGINTELEAYEIDENPKHSDTVIVNVKEMWKFPLNIHALNGASFVTLMNQE